MKFNLKDNRTRLIPIQCIQFNLAKAAHISGNISLVILLWGLTRAIPKTVQLNIYLVIHMSI